LCIQHSWMQTKLRKKIECVLLIRRLNEKSDAG
jgi:hypothetical protein